MLVCDDRIEELEKAKALLEDAGYGVITMLAFPNGNMMNAQCTNLRTRPEWLDGYFQDFDELINVIKDPALALRDPTLPNSVAMVLSDGYMGDEKVLHRRKYRAQMGTTLARIFEEERINTPMAIFTGANYVEREMLRDLLGDLQDKVSIFGKSDVVEAAQALSNRIAGRGV